MAGAALGSLIHNMVSACESHFLTPCNFSDRLHVLEKVNRFFDCLGAFFSQLTDLHTGRPNSFALEMTEPGLQVRYKGCWVRAEPVRLSEDGLVNF